MAEAINPVRPGDLITAQYMNGLVAALQALEVRVGKLEIGTGTPTTGALVILSPIESDTFQMGGPLAIVGRNFGKPSENTVTINEVIITQFGSGSDDRVLLIDAIPPVQNISVEGDLVRLTVSNVRGFAQTRFRLKRRQDDLPEGTIFARMSNPPTGTLDPGERIFGYTIRVLSTQEETYTVKPIIVAERNQADWRAVATPAEIALPRGDPPNGVTKEIQIKVTIPSGIDGSSATLRIEVASKRNPEGFSDTSPETKLKVGGAPPPAVPIDLKFSESAGGAASYNTTERVVEVEDNNTDGLLFFEAKDVDDNDYVIEDATFDNNPGNLWTFGFNDPTTIRGPQSSVAITVVISSKAGAAATKLRLKVRRKNDPAIGVEVSQAIRTK
jgi:hypothetical protein